MSVTAATWGPLHQSAAPSQLHRSEACPLTDAASAAPTAAERRRLHPSDLACLPAGASSSPSPSLQAPPSRVTLLLAPPLPRRSSTSRMRPAPVRRRPRAPRIQIILPTLIQYVLHESILFTHCFSYFRSHVMHTSLSRSCRVAC